MNEAEGEKDTSAEWAGRVVGGGVQRGAVRRGDTCAERGGRTVGDELEEIKEAGVAVDREGARGRVGRR